MYTIVPTEQYQKSLQKLLRGGVAQSLRRDMERVIDTLAAGQALPVANRDHQLKGPLKAYRECHIRPDVLLVYQKRENELVLVLIDIGSHSQLFS